MPKINKKIITIASVLFILIVLIVLALMSNSPMSNVQLPIPSPSPTPTSLPEDNPLNSVSLDQISPTTFPQTAPQYSYTLTKYNQITAQKIATLLNFNSTPKSIENGNNPLLIWNNQTHHLTISLNTPQISLSNLSASFIASSTGEFTKTPDMLIIQTQSLLNKLAIFDPKLTFVPTDILYYNSIGTDLAPISADQANLVTINLAPTIDDNSIYLSKDHFVQVSYDTEGKLIKLTLNNPISQITLQKNQSLFTFTDLKNTSPSHFFTINVNPKNLDEVYSPPVITSITPNQLSLGLLFDSKTQSLLPIFVLEKTAAEAPEYRFATLASQ